MSKGISVVGEATQYEQEGQEWTIQMHTGLPIVTQIWISLVQWG